MAQTSEASVAERSLRSSGEQYSAVPTNELRCLVSSGGVGSVADEGFLIFAVPKSVI